MSLAMFSPATAHRLLVAGTQIVALGEPTHGEPGFREARNAVLAALVEHGVRSIALETDAVAALLLADAVEGRCAVEDALAAGFSHGFGAFPANRALIEWLRDHNADRPPAERVTIHGFDASTEMTGAPSPRAAVQHLHDYLAAGRDDLDALLGDEARWAGAGPYADAPSPFGATAEAGALRVAVDDLLVDLLARAPALVAATSPDAWWAADLHGRAARWLLRYHAASARGGDLATRMGALGAVRSAWMAENLLAIRAREHGRGPTLVFAHNLHLRPVPGGTGAGSVVTAVLGEGYRFVAGALGASATLGVGAPPAGTLEALLAEAAGDGTALVDGPAVLAAGRPGRTDLPSIVIGPDADTLGVADAVLYVSTADTTAALATGAVAARIAALPGVTMQVGAGPDIPPSMVGACFFYAGQERRMPFATIVEHDTPGGDEESALHRPGAWRLNVRLGRAEFTRSFGFPPGDLDAHRPEIDFTALDVLLPHPVYGDQGWGAITAPTAARLPRIDELLRRALGPKS